VRYVQATQFPGFSYSESIPGGSGDSSLLINYTNSGGTIQSQIIFDGGSKNGNIIFHPNGDAGALDVEHVFMNTLQFDSAASTLGSVTDATIVSNTHGDIILAPFPGAPGYINLNSSLLSASSSLCLDAGKNIATTGCGGGTVTIASGTISTGTPTISSGSCATVTPVTATGALSTDVVKLGFNGDPTGTVGWQPLTTGIVTLFPWFTTNTLNLKICNMTASPITIGALTLNWTDQR
jgi:hypothetical protein